jgi:excisionase family DNA binding protein
MRADLIKTDALTSLERPLVFENPKILLSYKQAARCLSISEPHLRRLKQQGKIPFINIGRSVRFSLSSLNSWVEKREIG